MLPEGKCRYIDGQIYPDGNFYVLDTQHIKHNGSELKSALNGIITDISNKVDKVAGKGLSTEDYTTTEKNKLSGIANNANNYVHPTTSGNKHIPSGGSDGKILGWDSDGTAKWVDPTGGGAVDTVYIGSTEYAPDANGKVTLPTYPTTLPASDVYSWAKASTKPTYTASEVGLGNVGNFKAVSTVASQGLSSTEQSNARANLGLGTAATKSTTTSVTSGSSALITSGAVYSKISPTSFSTVSAIGSYISNIEGGYVRIGNLVVINIRCTVNAATPSTWTTLISGFPYPVVKYGTGSSGLALTNNRQADMALTGVGQIASATAIAAGTLLIDGVYITK